MLALTITNCSLRIRRWTMMTRTMFDKSVISTVPSFSLHTTLFSSFPSRAVIVVIISSTSLLLPSLLSIHPAILRFSPHFFSQLHPPPPSLPYPSQPPSPFLCSMKEDRFNTFFLLVSLPLSLPFFFSQAGYSPLPITLQKNPCLPPLCGSPSLVSPIIHSS